MPLGIVDSKLQVLENIVRLRRVQAQMPASRDLAQVRAWLELEVGPTVSQRLAARFLGTSHTALRRWITSEDLPLVYSESGRREVPVDALLRLRDAVEAERDRGSRRRHVLEPSLLEARRRAEEMEMEMDALPRANENPAGGHGRAERRGLAYHRVVASRLQRSMADEALHRVWKWREQGKLDPRYAVEWERVLHGRLPEIRDLLTADTPRARDLRQNSPFAGMLSEPERRKILERVR